MLATMLVWGILKGLLLIMDINWCLKENLFPKINAPASNDITKRLVNVLVVDDEPDINMTLKATLEDEGFKVYVFDDPIEALEHFRKRFYDLLIFDIKMPKMNGFELYREIKRIDRGVKVCFLTAGEMYYGAYGDIFDKLGANCFIRKPIENVELLKRLNEIISVQ
jgi:two-component system, OmpR family, response regulator ChvI